jgi:ATP-dependent exoDNAse (exonuclease V) beta subunit
MSESRSVSPSPEQQTVIDTWGKGLAILAGAGSGKTTTLVSKCVQLIQLNPKARFAAVSFTERSASDLKEKLSLTLSKILGPTCLHSHWIMTIHGLCGSIIKEYPREAGMDGEESILTEPEAQLLWEKALESLWLDELPDEIRLGFEVLLDRESRDGLEALLKRVKDLSVLGVMEFLDSLDNRDSQALSKVSRYVIDRYERLKQRQGFLDFNDLERGAARALESPSVRDAYHHRFDLVLVDEFQDTNPNQAQIIRKLARPDLSNLCVVGDPKQSIYRFRDADVSVFRDFCSQMPVQQSLTWNFRSRPGIIDFANRVCEKAFEASEMEFESLVPRRESIPDQPSVVRLDIQNPTQLGHWILNQVSEGIPLHEMVLLVRKIRGNEKWFKALTGCGIPLAIGSGGLFWEDPRVRELVAFLKWWDNPGNALSGATFLRAPWMKISDVDLDRWVSQDPTWKEPFFKSSHLIAESLRPFLSQIVRPGELLMALLIDQAIEDELAAPLMGLWHRVEALSSRGLDFHSVIVELSSTIQENRREREVPAPKNLGQLPVLTFHGAKGLEFSHVILVDLGEKNRASDMPLLFWDRQKGAYLGNRNADGDRDRDDPVESGWRESEKRKNLEESKRLFYVALTRARERLILVCPELKDADTEFQPEVVLNQDFWRGWIECSGYSLPQIKLAKATGSFQGQHQLVKPSSQKSFLAKKQRWSRARHSVTEWTLLSRCPRAYEWTFIRPVAVSVGLPEIGLLTGEKVTTWLESEISHQELGTRVHACLEKGDFNGLKELENEIGPNRFSADPIISWALSSSWMAPSQPSQQRTVWTELVFEVPLKNEILVGSMDRVILNEQSGRPRYTLIDFKVSERPKSTSALLQAYQTQMELYAWALTAMDPKAVLSDVETVLVNLSAVSVQVVPIFLGRLNLDQLVGKSLEIIDGAPGQPAPSLLCRYCEFRTRCPEGSQWGSQE